MVQRAEREPSMEEIVVALRETRRDADRMAPFGGATQARGFRAAKGMHGSTDLTDLRDTEIERLLEENARLNARVVALLKVIEREQANHAAETADETSPAEVDREAICREVRAALEAELGPVLVILLRLLQKQHAEAAAGDRDSGPVARLSTRTDSAASDWIVDLMHRLDGKASPPDETGADEEATQRRPKLRQCMADVLGAFGIESPTVASRRRFTSRERPS
jgi:hypothetical protein